MTQDYPYIQTLSNFDEGISAYAIQPVAEDESAELPEENPIIAFGPLGKINIFVGATNAGKSRFLRTLAKCESFQFLTHEIHSQIWRVIELSDFMAKSSASLNFHVAQEGNNYTGGLTVYTHMPDWVREAFEGINPNVSFDVTFDSDYFKGISSNLLVFLNQKLISIPKGHFISQIQFQQEALWLRNLIKGLAKMIQTKNRYVSAHFDTNLVGENQSVSANLRQFSWKYKNANDTWKQAFLDFWDAFDILNQSETLLAIQPPKRYYIPVLRSAVSLRDTEGKRLTYDIFEETVKRNYKLEESDLQIFTGNRLYDTIADDIRGDWKIIDRFRDFEKFLGDSFYEGRKVEIVARSPKYANDQGEHICLRVDGEGETARELHHLGDGINTLVILLYQLFMAEPGSWIFIEEPELNLHPGLQRVFLQTLIENEALQKRNLRVFFTTHSNHLLRMTLRDGTIAAKDISVFAFQHREAQKDHFLIRPLVSEYHDALALLGVQNASVLLAQCGIWVEGITDRQYLRAYLDAYQTSDEFKLKTMREDTHFAFWEYAGSNLSHYFMGAIPRRGTPEAELYEQGKKEVLGRIESSALSNRIFLLADCDEKKQRKHDDLKNLAKNRGNFVYYVTPCIEIENLLSPTELQRCLPKFFGKDSLPAVSFTQADYKNTRLGSFLFEKYPDYCPDGWIADSGTLISGKKTRLCESVIPHIKWDTMSKEAKNLTKSLYEFIRKHNDI